MRFNSGCTFVCLFALPGIGDITGEITEGGFMGYAVPNQIGTGLHTRQFARAFVIQDPASGAKVIYVSMDFCMGFQMVKLEVIERLQKIDPTITFDNVILSGTHTHSTPGGLGGTALVDITTFGFIKHNFEAGVAGIVNAVRRALANVKPGNLKMAVGQLDGGASAVGDSWCRR